MLLSAGERGLGAAAVMGSGGDENVPGLDGCGGARPYQFCYALPRAADLALDAEEEEVVLLLCPTELEGAILGGEGGISFQTAHRLNTIQ